MRNSRVEQVPQGKIRPSRADQIILRSIFQGYVCPKALDDLDDLI